MRVFIWMAWLLVAGPTPVLSLGAVPGPAPVHQPRSALFLDDEFPPPPEGTRGFDVQRYDLDIRLDPTSSYITGTVDLQLMSVQTELAQVQLDLVSDLTCTGVNLEGEPQTFTHADDALIISLAQPLATGQSTTLQISWQGRPPRHGEMLVGLLFRRHNAGTLDDPSDDVPIIANVSEPWSAHSWWPCKDNPADKALVSTSVTVPDTLSVVCNGTLLGTENVEPGWRRYRYQEQFPLPTYLVSVAASNYVSWGEDCQAPPGTLPLEYHVFPQDEQKARTDFALTCDMMQFMAGLAGPYPFAPEKYAQVEIKWIGAMEHSTATSISQLLITGDGSYETLVLHELAHHWFGNSLTPGNWADIWLNEGFARYCEALWVENRYGPEAYQEFMRSIGRDRHPDFFANLGTLSDPHPILPNILVYDKGAWLLHSLRALLGDPEFFALLETYVQGPGRVHGTVSTADFIHLAEMQTGGALGSFFEPWLSTSAVPVVQCSAERNGQSLRLTLRQTQPTLFQLKVPVMLETVCGTQEILLEISDQEQTFTLEAPCRITGYAVDPRQTAFLFLEEAPPPALAVSGLRPNPIPGSGGSISIYTARDGILGIVMYDVRGRICGEWDLGQVPATGTQDQEGSQPLTWDLQLDALDRPAAAGVYWLEVKLDQARTVRKFTLLK